MRSAHIEKSSRSYRDMAWSLDVSSQFTIRRLHSFSSRRGRSPGPLTLASLRPRHLRSGRRGGRLLLLLLAQRVEHAPALPLRRLLLGWGAGILDDGARLAIPTGQDRQEQAGGEEDHSERRGGAGEP